MTRETDNEAFVRDFQAHARERGVYSGDVDGWAGAKTRKAAADLCGTPLPPGRDEHPPDSLAAPLIPSSPTGGGVIYRGRAAWGADPKLPRLGHRVDPARRTEVFVHHTVTLDGDDTKSVWETLDEIAAHMRRLQKIRPDLGLDVPYSAVCHVTPTGGLVICEGRGFDRTGAHTSGRNTPALGFSWAGDFESHPPPAELLDRALVAFGLYLRELRAAGFPNLGSNRPSTERAVWGHRDIKATACPGRALWERLATIKF